MAFKLGEFVQSCIKNDGDINLLSSINLDVLSGTAKEFYIDIIEFIKEYYSKYGEYPSEDKIPNYIPIESVNLEKPEWYLDESLNPQKNIILELKKLQLSKLTAIDHTSTAEDIEALQAKISEPVVFLSVNAQNIDDDFDEDRYDISGGELLPTGLTTFDKVLGGIDLGELVSFVALPKTGKTTLLCALASRFYQEGNRVLLATMETTRRAMLNKIDSIIGGFNNKMFRIASVDTNARDFLLDIRNEMLNVHKEYSGGGGVLHVINPINMLEIESQVYKQDKTGKPYDIVITDNFYLLQGKRGEMGWAKDASNFVRLKAIAIGKMMDKTPTSPTRVITSSQLDAKDSNKVGLDAIKKTVAISETSDCVIALTKDNGIVNANVLLNRNAEMGFTFNISIDFENSKVGEYVSSNGHVNSLVIPRLTIPQPKIGSPTTRGSSIV